MTKFFRLSFFAVFAIVSGAFIFSPSAQAATSTVCASGCDFSSLADAIAADLPGADTIVITSPEFGSHTLPEDTTLTCEPGVIFGDNSEAQSNIGFSHNSVVRNCSFENVAMFGSSASNNIAIMNNTWSIPGAYLNMSDVDGLTLSGNQGLDQVYLVNMQNTRILDNDFLSNNGSLFIWDSSDTTVNGNVFTNNTPAYISSSWVTFNNVSNLEFTSNTLESVPLTGSHIMMQVNGVGDIAIRGNLFLYPEDISVINGGIQGLFISQLYPQNDDVHFSVENNSFISNQPVASNALAYACTEVDYGGNPGDTGQITVQFDYNLCSLAGAGDSNVAVGFGLRTDVSLVNNLTFTDEHNGFFGMQNALGDYDNSNYVYNPSASSLNVNTLYRKPVFRTENIDTSDDYQLVPMSPYLDVNGMRDVGAFAGGPRITSYTIDDDCVVDYTACHSQTTEILSDVLMNGHTVTTAPGTYSGATITGPLSNITIQGAGASTILDGSIAGRSALSLTNVTDSSFSDMRLMGSTNRGSGFLGGTYMTFSMFSAGGTDYSSDNEAYFISSSGVDEIEQDNDPVPADGIANINGFLLAVSGGFTQPTTMFAPADFADSAQDLENVYGVVVDYFIEDMFIANGDGTYSYNPTNLNNQNITLISGLTNPPAINTPLLREYQATLTLLSVGGDDYDSSGQLDIYDNFYGHGQIAADGDPLYLDGTTNFDGLLLDFGGYRVTMLVANTLSDEFQIGYAGIITHVIEDMFIANGDGTYSYNSTNLDNQGITVLTGLTSPPAITAAFTPIVGAGLELYSSSNNTIENLLSDGNRHGVAFMGTSTNNVISNSIFTGNTISDIYSDTPDTNDLLDVFFARASSTIEDGAVRVLFSSAISIVDPLNQPLSGVEVDFISANNATNITNFTDSNGLTPTVQSLAYLMTPSSIELINGGYNPFTITAYATGTYPTTSTAVFLATTGTFEVVMNVASPVTPPSMTSGGGGGSLTSIDPRTGTYPPIEPPRVAPMVIESRLHMLVKLVDDGSLETQEDSTVYYIGADKKRHIIPSESVFMSWYCDFSKIIIVDREFLAKYPIGKNVTYRPGLNLVKFPTSPRVYVVQADAILRHIKDEAEAVRLFGSTWTKDVHDLSDTAYGDYTFGDELGSVTDLSVLNLSPNYPSGEMSIEGYYEIVTGGQECR